MTNATLLQQFQSSSAPPSAVPPAVSSAEPPAVPSAAASTPSSPANLGLLPRLAAVPVPIPAPIPAAVPTPIPAAVPSPNPAPIFPLYPSLLHLDAFFFLLLYFLLGN